MKKVIAILIFEGAEEMDFVGPWEVLAAAAEAEQDWRVVTVAATLDPIRCEKRMRVIPDCTYSDIDRADVIVIPGGSGARREIDNPLTIQWLRLLAPHCRWVTSVCTGAFLLVGSGIAQDRKVTTHHRFIGKLRGLGAINVVEGARFVRDGNVISAGGVMSGIEMSLWLVGQIWGAAAVERTKDYIAYDFPPRSSSIECA
jgi:transcriptional regulator GlxA family with amidase domain